MELWLGPTPLATVRAGVQLSDVILPSLNFPTRASEIDPFPQLCEFLSLESILTQGPKQYILVILKPGNSSSVATRQGTTLKTGGS